MRALVTGCAGFIGSHLTESLLRDGHDVVGVDCFNDNYARPQKLGNLEHAQAWDRFDFIPIDLARGDLYDLVVESDCVFHLAAEPGVRASWGSRFEHYLRNNVLSTQHLLDAARKVPDTPFVYASSSSIYGQAERLPTHEDTLPKPFSPYGVTKLAGENLCRLYHANYGVRTVSLRFFSVYGPRQRPDMAFYSFCHAALSGEEVIVYGDGEQTRDFTYVDDIVTATRVAATTPAAVGGVFNVGGGSQVSVNHALDLLATFTSQALAVHYQEGEHGDVRDTGADTTRAREALGFAARTELADGLAAELEWVGSGLPQHPNRRTVRGPESQRRVIGSALPAPHQ
jgi:UDP-glucose 4-epimerase